jgi:hypothetical protein
MKRVLKVGAIICAPFVVMIGLYLVRLYLVIPIVAWISPQFAAELYAPRLSAAPVMMKPESDLPVMKPESDLGDAPGSCKGLSRVIRARNPEIGFWDRQFIVDNAKKKGLCQ